MKLLRVIGLWLLAPFGILAVCLMPADGDVHQGEL